MPTVNAPGVTKTIDIIQCDGVSSGTTQLSTVTCASMPTYSTFAVVVATGYFYTLVPITGITPNGVTVVRASDGVRDWYGGPGSITQLTSAGDVTATGPGAVVASIVPGVVNNTKLAAMPAHTYKGNAAGSTAPATDLTQAQLTSELNLFTTSLQGLAPGSGGGSTNFLRADGTWNAPALSSISNDASQVGDILATAIAAPATPAAGKGRTYVDSTSKNMAVKNDAGVVNHGIQTKAAVSHQFLTSVADDGSSVLAQPVVADISGLAAVASSGSIGDIADNIRAMMPTAWSSTVQPYAATTGPGTLSTSFAVGQVVDGRTLVLADIILIKNQVNAAENGIYTVNNSGAPTRHTSYNTGASFVGAAVEILAIGVTTGQHAYACINQTAPTLGTTPIVFVEVPNNTFVNNGYASIWYQRGSQVALVDGASTAVVWTATNRFPSGTAGLPSVTFASDPGADSGLYFTGTDGVIGWSSNATAQLQVGPSGLLHSTRHQVGKGADIACAASITLGNDGNFFNITGTAATLATISSTNWQAGSRVTLCFTAASTFNNTGNITFRSPTTTKTNVANDTYDFVWDGSKWRCLA
jgi:hypothetical protein